MFSFVCRCECIEVAAEDILCGKGYDLTLFLFTDILLIAKRKTGKIGGMLRSPSAASIASGQVTLQTKVNIAESPSMEKGHEPASLACSSLTI